MNNKKKSFSLKKELYEGIKFYKKNIKIIIKNFTPPILFSSIYNMQRRLFSHNTVSGRYKSWEEAIKSLPFNFTWNSDSYLSELYPKHLSYLNRLKDINNKKDYQIRTLGLFIAINKSTNSVLDYGGGVGFHYEVVSNLIGHVNWTILETPEFIKHFSVYANPKQKFV